MQAVFAISEAATFLFSSSCARGAMLCSLIIGSKCPRDNSLILERFEHKSFSCDILLVHLLFRSDTYWLTFMITITVLCRVWPLSIKSTLIFYDFKTAANYICIYVLTCPRVDKLKLNCHSVDFKFLVLIFWISLWCVCFLSLHKTNPRSINVQSMFIHVEYIDKYTWLERPIG